MVALEVDALALEALERGDLHDGNEAAPQVAQLALRAADVDLHLLDARARLLEGLDRLVDHGDHARIDREDAVVARIGDRLAGDRAAQRRHEVDAAFDAVGVARIVARQDRHRQGGILDGPA